MYKKKAHIHFIGIGGIGMSGIAKILRHQGYIVSGCDKNINQKSITELSLLGCAIYAGNNTVHCHDGTIDIIVYSSAISVSDNEIISAQNRGIPTIQRALMLAELMRTKYSIAIAGSHGKTTTSSLISHILIEANFDPTVIIGGHLINISTNARIGQGAFLVAESDESDRSFLHLQTTLALITNIDLEHLETYKDLDDIKQTYECFLNNLPFYGKAFVCIDDENIRSMLPMPHIKMITYGLSHKADITARNYMLYPSHSTFDLMCEQEYIGPITLHMPGKHNILNCLGAIAVCLDVGVPFSSIQKAIAHFQGIERRFWLRGTFKGAEIFDDYAHHPKEIEQTLLVAHQRKKNKLIVVFQPHRFTRMYHLWNDFLEVFEHSPIDQLIITDIYSAHEEPVEGIHAQRFVQELQSKHSTIPVSYVPMDHNFAQLREVIDRDLGHDDLLLLLGAGNLTHLATFIT